MWIKLFNQPSKFFIFIFFSSFNIFILIFRARLKQLELESEKLDESFQAYLKRQSTEKTKLNEDIAKIWQNYQIDKENFNQQVDSITINKPPIMAFQTNQDDQLNTVDKNNVNYALNILKDLNVDELDKKIDNPYFNFHPKNLIKEKSRPIETKYCESKTVQCGLVNGTDRDAKEKSVASSRVRKKVKILTSSSESSDEKIVENIKVNGIPLTEEAKTRINDSKTEKVENSKISKALIESQVSNKVNEHEKISMVSSENQSLFTKPVLEEKSVLSTELKNLSDISKLKDLPEFSKTNGDEQKQKIDYLVLNQNGRLDSNKAITNASAKEISELEPAHQDPASIVLNDTLEKILERNTKEQFQTEFVLITSSSELSDEKQQISTEIGRTSSPDDFWK